MTGPSSTDAIFYLLVLILPLSSLLAMRLPIGSIAKMALGWIAIFAVLAILVGQRERFRPLWDGAVAAVGGDEQTVQGSTVRIPIAPDGHFWASVRINGAPVRLLVDTGATLTSLSEATAKDAGVAVDNEEIGIGIETANGRIVAKPATVNQLTLGTITARDLPVAVAAEFGDTSVLGMNFLSRLADWRVEGRTLVLTPKQNP